MITQIDLNWLVDRVPETQLETANRFLEFLRENSDVLPKTLEMALEDDEHLDSETLDALDKVERDSPNDQPQTAQITIDRLSRDEFFNAFYPAHWWTDYCELSR